MEKKSVKVTSDDRQRIDVFLRETSGLSRSQIKHIMDNGNVSLNGKITGSPGYKLKRGDYLEYLEELPKKFELIKQDIPLNIIYEDDNMMIINKQAGLVVHPSPGHSDGTLVNALVGKHINEEDYEGTSSRIGIVHRLDRDTSGLMIIARNGDAHHKLAALFKEKKINKTYRCIVHGRVEQVGHINTHIVRDANNRLKYTAKYSGGKEAYTIFEPEEIFSNTTLLKVRILTGRTHQIRVHMNYIKNEVVGDPVYGNKSKDNDLAGCLGYDIKSREDLLPRQMLHASELEFENPFNGKKMFFSAEIPDDMKRVLSLLRARAR
ncbi:MAG: RluA family pseudouridine synthase [Candidatus Goldiibacteriota bacterium HGW-Goldbacteria-1]|jgi:23S rRNA pseudouridine1911/1915/1917 synthase|nr:MAG: RluA family pseudouridine synthase [Candidatus Goldiibacteriota bacterium HGW-Goldbacteria-1]